MNIRLIHPIFFSRSSARALDLSLLRTHASVATPSDHERRANPHEDQTLARSARVISERERGGMRGGIREHHAEGVPWE